MSFKSGLLVALFLATGCADQLVLDDDGALLVIPHEVGSQGHIIVQATINDHGPYRFALDTGASISVVFDKTREQSDLELLAGEQVLVHGMIGSGHFPLTNVTEFKIGNESWSNARMASLPGNSSVPPRSTAYLGSTSCVDMRLVSQPKIESSVCILLNLSVTGHTVDGTRYPYANFR
jgi:hypothetical protein